MAPRSVLVTGANRGLGLELVHQLLAAPAPPRHIIATYRAPATATKLLELAEAEPSVTAVQLDVTDTAALPGLVARVAEVVGEDGLNLLINNAGCNTSQLGDLQLVTEEQMVETFRTNCSAPLLLSRALIPLLQRAADSRAGEGMAVGKAAIVQVSSIAGSIAEVSEPWAGMYAYRVSKTALNMASACLAMDVGKLGVLVTCIHPGWVSTDMGGPKAPLTPTAAVATMLETMNSLTEGSHGAFLNYDGKPMAW